MDATVKLYSLTYNNSKTYLFVLLFVAGNILLPQLCHLIPRGGLIFLPIYFFTLIAAYKYGLMVGLLTAVLSPLVNHILFGMPPSAALPAILIKSSILAIAAAASAHYFKKVSLWGVLLAVLAYQIIGILFEWALVKDFYVAIQDFRMGMPGILLQIIGGYILLKSISKI
ncbi:MAG: hypothetical protein LBP34_04130 [Flavobacteriaceae bacterium]|jgi:hypothetical protein|nr:hypothetical protein [Flavobacteriaceae bacterium]